jgi:crotonobetainyl-CoA:carnitine CoA-transferase CaiB-like acyl-CoA transferase
MMDDGNDGALRRGPLSRFRVLDLTRVRAGPTAVKQLSDWGADVIKIESPLEDDMTGARDGSDFQNLNRNKRAMTLDLKKPGGIAVLKRLVVGADVLAENFRPDVKHRLGFDYETMRAVNPRLVYASMSGFGQEGPYRTRPGFDQIAQAMGGLQSITGAPGQGPQPAGIPVADLSTGLFAAIGILVALLDREASGQGRWVQASLLQSQLAMLDFHAAAWLIDRKISKQVGNRHATTVPMGVYPSKDGHVVMGASGQAQYRKLCELLGLQHMMTDPRFAEMEARAENAEAYIAELSDVTRRYTSVELVEMLNAAGLACGPINSIDKVLADPQVQKFGMVRPVQHARLGQLNLLSAPIKLSGIEPVMERAAPEKGEHTDEILAESGFTSEEIADLRQGGIVA